MQQLREKEKAYLYKRRMTCVLENENEKISEIEKEIDAAFFKKVWYPECVTDKDSWPIMHSEE